MQKKDSQPRQLDSVHALDATAYMLATAEMEAWKHQSIQACPISITSFLYHCRLVLDEKGDTRSCSQAENKVSSKEKISSKL
jgi:hypothetical protein